MADRPLRVRLAACVLREHATVYAALRLHTPAGPAPPPWRTDVCTTATPDPRTRLHPVRFSTNTWTVRLPASPSPSPGVSPADVSASSSGFSCSSSCSSSSPSPLSDYEDATAAAAAVAAAAAAVAASASPPPECPVHRSPGPGPVGALCTCPRLAVAVHQLVQAPGAPHTQPLAATALVLSPALLADVAAAGDTGLTVQCPLERVSSSPGSTRASARSRSSSALSAGLVTLELAAAPSARELPRTASTAPVPLSRSTHSHSSKRLSAKRGAAASSAGAGTATSVGSPPVSPSSISNSNSNSSSSSSIARISISSSSGSMRRHSSRAPVTEGSLHRVLAPTGPDSSTDGSCGFTAAVHAAVGLPVPPGAAALPSVFVLLRRASRRPQHGGEKAASLVEHRRRNAVWRSALRLRLAPAEVDAERMHLALTDRACRQHVARAVVRAAAVRPFVQHHACLVLDTPTSPPSNSNGNNNSSAFALVTLERDPLRDELLAFRDDAHCSAHLTVSEMRWTPRCTSATSASSSPQLQQQQQQQQQERAVMVVARAVPCLAEACAHALAVLAAPPPATAAAAVALLPFVPVRAHGGVFVLDDVPESDCVVSPVSAVAAAPAWGATTLAMFLDTHSPADDYGDGGGTEHNYVTRTGSSEGLRESEGEGGVVFQFFDCRFARDPAGTAPGAPLVPCGFAAVPLAALHGRGRGGVPQRVALPVTTDARGRTDAVFGATLLLEDAAAWLAQRFAVHESGDDADAESDGYGCTNSSTSTTSSTSIACSSTCGGGGAEHASSPEWLQSPARICRGGRGRGTQSALQMPTQPRVPPAALFPHESAEQLHPARFAAHAKLLEQRPPPVALPPRTSQVPLPYSASAAPQATTEGQLPPSPQSSPGPQQLLQLQQQQQQVQQQAQQAQAQQVLVRTGSGQGPFLSANETYLAQSLERAVHERDVLAQQLAACEAELAHVRALCGRSLAAYRRQAQSLALLAHDSARVPALERRVAAQATEIAALRLLVLQMRDADADAAAAGPPPQPPRAHATRSSPRFHQP